VRECVSKLMAAKLIAPVEDKISKLDREFFDYLGMQLSLAVGPIAQVLIEEAVMDLGHDQTRFPSHRVAELVDLLAREIQREDKRAVFKQNMIQKIRERG
jgi:hypothetical protein